ncbi:hypothetical protein ACFFX1_23435 [Dactylosporangium sucinum]|uniref:Uncharacterized protein n=1 Tax=Dactylosporangium sucinum TaxID=1424081 RepID=A0A917U0H2_9ACTN|nr:hypothetical protein [Dactylosporangium sucinum]GGM48666.1 hypothetical protein GCM10007977_057830 [Dactylosporangium sucinum]
MKLTKTHLGAGTLALGAVLAFAVPAGAAVNLQSESNGSSSIKIAKTANLKAKGAATVVTVKVGCPVGARYQVGVEVGQVVNGNTTAHGTAYLYNQVCTGAVENVKLHVLADGAPFKPGVAYAVGSADISGPAGYWNLNTGREIVNVNN